MEKENKPSVHQLSENGAKKPSVLRNIVVVIIFILVSMGMSVSIHDYAFSNFIDNTFISVALSILCGIGFSYLFMTFITKTSIIKK